ncbi:hypothetical protein [Enterovirga sp.]|uniref:hypothetical protein n=1 Tax=Enterovirga sp. TaxID=2026350 RepID=UPI002BD8B8CB|nr:hypothetical protein [Enterovirga sp.]HMO27875.1 hypothetical protein [Enterovirga sp.]
MTRVSLILGCLVIAATPALADQCSWNSKPVAEKALTYLGVGSNVQEFCRPCSDKKASKITVATAESKQVDTDYYQVQLNGRGVDLAYLFVQQKGSKTWTNLGRLVKCLDDIDNDKTLPASLVDK